MTIFPKSIFYQKSVPRYFLAVYPSKVDGSVLQGDRWLLKRFVCHFIRVAYIYTTVMLFMFVAKNDDAKDRERRETFEGRTRRAESLPNAEHATENDFDNVQLVC